MAIITKEKFLKNYQRARNSGTPLIGISCIDPESTMVSIQKISEGCPIIQWDILDGWKGRNSEGINAIEIALGGEDIDNTINPTENLKFAQNLPENSILFLLNPQHFFDRPDFLQALWNLRNKFKSRLSSVVLLGPNFTLPDQLQQDIFLIDEPLPSDEELRAILDELIDSVQIEVSEKDREKSVDALRGLSSFAAEQTVAMCLRKSGIDIQGLWERKRKLISSTPGLRVYEGTETFEDIGGCQRIKQFLRNVITGKEAPRVIVFIDEGEKMFAGAVGDMKDSSGVSQDFLGTTLSYMEDNECDGVLFVGPPGAAKSAISKAVGNEAGIPTIMLDLGGMKGGLVGKSEEQIRNAYKIISAVGSGRAFFIMTCNKILDLPPELKRRFTSGTFFFDLPTKEEREKIWALYFKKYGIEPQNIKFDEGWTGAEIRNCCRKAYRENISLEEAAQSIVPVAISAGEQIKSLRKQAEGKYLSANEPGIYRIESEETPKRRILREV